MIKPFDLELRVPAWALDKEDLLSCETLGTLVPYTENKVRNPHMNWNFRDLNAPPQSKKLFLSEGKDCIKDGWSIFLIWCPFNSGHIVDDELGVENEMNCVPMSEYAIWSEVTVSQEALLTTSAQLKNLGQSGHKIFRIKTHTPELVRCLVLALHDVTQSKDKTIVAPGEINTRNAIHLLAVASALGLKALLRMATDVLIETLPPRDTLRAVAFAAAAKDLSLLLAAYCQIKALGFFGTEPHFGYDAQNKAIFFISSKLKSTLKRQLVPLSILEDMVARECALKEPFFSTVNEYDNIPHPKNNSSLVIIDENEKTKEALTTDISKNNDSEDSESMLALQLAGEDKEKIVSASPVSHGVSLFSSQLRRCYLVRRKGVTIGERDGIACDEFCLYDDHSLQLLVSARGRKGSSCFSLALARSSDEDMFFTPAAPEFLGQSTGNISGSRFILRDWGIDHLPLGCLSTLQRRVRAAVTYKANVLGRVPNSMRVALVHSSNTDHRRIVHRFYTRKAIWNSKLSMWTMDFQSRVKLASKKNLQLIQESSSGDSSPPQVSFIW